MAEMVQAHVTIRGRVQGVFFRAETQRAAQLRNLMGWVRNRPDGSVEAVFSGPKDAVDSMIEWCWQGSPRSRVEAVDLQWESHKGQFTRFEIAY